MRMTHATPPVLIIALVALLGTACATVPVSEEALDWKAADSRWSVHVVTVDPDGDERVTRVWLALVDGVGTIRTSDTRWQKNLERDPDFRMRVRGVDYPLRAVRVADGLEARKIDDAFLEKYGWQERLLMGSDPSEAHSVFFLLAPPE